MVFVDKWLYLSLYESYKAIKEERVAKKLGDYEINVIEGVKGILENFQNVDENSTKISKPLRFSKNVKINGYFVKIKKEDKKEKMKNYPTKFEPLSSGNNGPNIEIDENGE